MVSITSLIFMVRSVFHSVGLTEPGRMPGTQGLPPVSMQPMRSYKPKWTLDTKSEPCSITDRLDRRLITGFVKKYYSYKNLLMKLPYGTRGAKIPASL